MREAAVEGLLRDLREAPDLAITRGREAAKRVMKRLEDLTRPLGDSRTQVWPTPLKRAGKYIAGSRYPLLSFAMMTVVPARAAGIKKVLVCSPRARPVTVAAAHLA